MLAIARALMSRPRLLLLDEPSMGLAPLMVQKIFETIRSVAAEGVIDSRFEQWARDAPFPIEVVEVDDLEHVRDALLGGTGLIPPVAVDPALASRPGRQGGMHFRTRRKPAP